MPRPRDEFDDENRTSFLEILPLALIGKTLAAVVVLGVIAYAGWNILGGARDPSGPVPIIRADTTPLKETPQDPGGMAVPNANSTIFETLRGADDLAPRVENLLDEPEKPMTKEEALPVQMEAKKEPITDVRLKATGEDPITQTKDQEESQPPAPAPEKEEKSDIIAELKKEAGQEKVEAVKKEEPQKEIKPTPQGSSFVQLAAVKSDPEARTQWAKLKAKYPSLAALSLRVQRADLGEKGIFYRVQAGPTSADNAATICAKIKAAGGSCVVIK